MSKLFPKFFEGNEFFIDEKVNMFKFENEYKVFDEFGLQKGSIKQKITAGQKFLRLIISKAVQPFKLEITDADSIPLATITRGWTFWMSKIAVTDESGNQIGSIQQKFQFLKPKFIIQDGNGNQIAEIKGDWKAWNFTITDPSGGQIGVISKKWAGAMKEIFTSADKYNVSILPAVLEDQNKIVIVSAAITIDMVLKESKN
ncbi:MAG: LURP-one-related/scramblase family protein [Leadbetterella sp.]